MRTFATLKNFKSSAGKEMIVRNLNRIMDIAIIDIDVKNGTITFLHTTKIALEKTKRELTCIGFPIKHMLIQNGKTELDFTLK